MCWLTCAHRWAPILVLPVASKLRSANGRLRIASSGASSKGSQSASSGDSADLHGNQEDTSHIDAASNLVRAAIARVATMTAGTTASADAGATTRAAAAMCRSALGYRCDCNTKHRAAK